MKKIIVTVLIVILAIAALIGGAVFAYSESDDYDNNKFPENTQINGVDCSGLSYDEAAQKLTDEWNSKHITVTGPLNDDLAAFTDFGCSYKIDNKLKNAKHDNIFLAAFNHYIKTPLIVQFSMNVRDCGKEFKERVLSSDFLNSADATESHDAYVDLTKSDFPIVKEVCGTKPDGEAFFKDLLKHIANGEFKISFEEEDYYTTPKVTSENKKLLKYQKYCKKYLNQKITYSLGDETFTISAEQLGKLLKTDNSGDIDEAAVKEYVASLAAKYDNIGAERNFTSLSGKQIHVYGGTYGWQIDQEGEAAQLIKDIKSHKDVTREPVFSKKGYGQYSKNVGNTYIDVDISAQVVKFYIDGSLYFSSNCVTGCRATGTTTNTGTYYILNKARDVVLKGDNADGSKYESPVKYWLGVTWSGQGFHDADWRSSFGGSIWINNGSHGCVNMPPSRMGELYSAAEVGMPVVMHY